MFFAIANFCIADSATPKVLSMSGFSNEYAYWDHAMSQRNPDYITISHQMVALARQKVSNDSELLWRLSQATFGQTFKMDWVNNRAGIKAKTVEARHYAERAVKASPDSFGAHLWMSKYDKTTFGYLEGRRTALTNQ